MHPMVRRRLRTMLGDLLDIAPVESQIAYIKAEGEKWGTLVRKLGLEGSQ